MLNEDVLPIEQIEEWQWDTVMRHLNHYSEDMHLDRFLVDWSLSKPHFDFTNWAWLVSLTDESLNNKGGGTDFFRHKEKLNGT